MKSLKLTRRLLLRLLLVLTFVLISAACNEANQSTRIVFAHRGDHVYEIYSAKLDGNDLKLMTTIEPQGFSEALG